MRNKHQFIDAALWMVSGIAVSVIITFTAVVPLGGFGHGSPLFEEIYGAPREFGFLVPFITGILIGFRKYAPAAWGILFVELFHLSFVAVSAAKGKLDTTQFTESLARFPIITLLLSIAFYTGWHLIANGLMLQRLAQRKSG